MPKATVIQRARRQAPRSSPLQKRIRFTFKRQQDEIKVNLHDTAAVIYDAFVDATGTDSDIEILDSAGNRQQLNYRYLKDNGKIQVHRIVQRMQAALGAGAAPQRTKNALEQILENWKLDHVFRIFGDNKYAPREIGLDGQRATYFNITPVMHPLAWSANFTTALLQLSKNTIGRHSEALDSINEVVEARYHRTGHHQQLSMEAMTADVWAASKRFKTQQLIQLANNATNVAYNMNMVGGLADALPEITQEEDPAWEGLTFDIPMR